MKKIINLTLALLAVAVIVSAQTGTRPAAVINHLAIFVTDLQRSGDFYMRIVGLDSINEPFHDGKHLWLGIGPKASLHIIQGAEEPKEYFKNNHICFSVASVEAFTEKLKKENIHCLLDN